MTKGERVNRIHNELWDEEELLRRLPEIDAIYDEDLRDGVIRTFMDGCPDSFWKNPSSSSGKYHSTDEIGEYGNWLHTKRVFAVYCAESESALNMHHITEYQRECGKAAALIHDMMKYGWPSERNDHTVNHHDLVAADVAVNIGGLPEEVGYIIERHMGSWGDGPVPEWTDRVALLLQFSDKIASRRWVDVGVYFPAEELTEKFPDLITIPVEEGEAI